MFDKSLEFWAIIVGMSVYVATRDAEKEPLQKRMIKVVTSGFLTIGLVPELAPFVQDSEGTAAVLIMAFGILILDLLSALVSDRAFITEIIKRHIGGSKDE